MKKFTAEEIELLKQNPYTLYVTSSRLNLTLAAKEQIVTGDHYRKFPSS